MDTKFRFIENPNEQISNIKDYIYRVLSNWKWFVATVVVAMSIAYYVNISALKQYSLGTTIMVKEKQNPLFSSGTNIAFNWGGVSDKVESIRKALASRTHNEKVIRDLKYYIEYLEEGRFRFEDAYGKAPFLVNLQPNQFQLLNTMIKIDFISEEQFELTVDFDPKTTYQLINYTDEAIKEYDVEETKVTRTYNVDDYINLPFFMGQLVPSNEYSRFRGTYYLRFNTVNRLAGQYRNVRTRAIPGTSLIELSLVGANKARMVDYLNKAVEILAFDELEAKTNYARNTRAFIDEQFKITSDSLRVIEDSIGKFKQENLIYNLSAEGNEIYSQTTGLDKLQIELGERLEYLDNLSDYILTHTDYSKIPAPAIISIEDSKISSMVSELMTKSIEKEQLVGKVTDNHPSLIQINAEIETVKNVLMENLSSLKKLLEVQRESNRRRLNVYNYELTKLPNKEQVLLNFQRKFNLTESNYEFLMQKRYEADIAIAATESDITVLDTAKDIGQGPILPRKPFNYMVALLLGTIVPLFVIIAKEILDTHIHGADEVERLTPIPILGIVGKKTTEKNLNVYLKPRSAIAESFRAIRSNIQFLFVKSESQHKKCKTIVVTSSVSGEGKTFISLNLATVFALGGKKTALIGMDLRKPKIHEEFDTKNDLGIVNYLLAKDSLDTIIQDSEVPNLDVIMAGPVPPNPSELIISPATDELFKELKEKYEYIVIDTPPIGIVSDALELLKYADASAYVVRQNYSQKGMLKLINEKYEKNEIENISIVLNNFNVKSKYGYEYGYGYGYSGYGKYGKGYHEDERPSLFNRIFRRNRKFK